MAIVSDCDAGIKAASRASVVQIRAPTLAALSPAARFILDV